jgi:hypothetical protein
VLVIQCVTHFSDQMASSATLAVPSIAAPSMLAHNYPQNAPRLAAATDAASQQRERRTTWILYCDLCVSKAAI